MIHLSSEHRSRFAVLSFSVLGLLAAPSFAQAQQQDTSSKPQSELSRVVITASGTEQLHRNAPASITVFSRTQMERQRNSSLAELLGTVEGIDVGNSVGKTGGLNISMRGMPSDYTLVLIDGRRQNAAGNITPNGFGETSTSFLPPISAIERIEIIRGPMATLYGSDAMGGVINIITRRVSRAWTGSLSTDATIQENSGFGSTQSVNGSVTGPLLSDKLGMTLRGSFLHRNQSELDPTGEFGENTSISRRGPSPVGADIYSFGGRVSFTPNRSNDLTVDADVFRQDYDNRKAQLGTLDRPDATPPTFNGYSDRQKFNRQQFVLGHTYRFGLNRIESSLMRNMTETLGRTLPNGTPGGPPGSGAPNKPAGDPRTLESTSDLLDSRLVSVLGKHLLSVGGQLWNAKMVDGVALEPFEQTQWSLFAEDQWNFHEDFTLTLGIRQDQHNSFGGHTTPRAYLVWRAAPQITFKGGVSSGYKTPRLEQLVEGITGFTGQGRSASIGSPHLKPETSISTDLGVFYENESGFGANVSMFHNRFKDKISSGTPVANCTFAGAPDLPGCVNYGNFPTQETFGQSINIDKAETQGAEVGLRIPLVTGWSFNTNYTFTESRQLSGSNEGYPLTNTPKHMVNSQIRALVTDKFQGWVSGEYRSKRLRRLSGATNLAYNALGDYRQYSLFHLGGSYDITRAVTVRATVYNVLNTDFLEYASYQGNPTAANPSGILYTNLYNNHQEGRRLWLSTTLTF